MPGKKHSLHYLNFICITNKILIFVHSPPVKAILLYADVPIQVPLAMIQS